MLRGGDCWVYLCTGLLSSVSVLLRLAVVWVVLDCCTSWILVVMFAAICLCGICGLWFVAWGRRCIWSLDCLRLGGISFLWVSVVFLVVLIAGSSGVCFGFWF